MLSTMFRFGAEQ